MDSKKIYIFLMLVILGMFTVSLTMKPNDEYQGLSDRSQALYRLNDRVGKQIAKKFDMHYCGSGVGGGGGPIWMMGIAFQKYDSSLSEKQARQLIVNATNDYLEAINQDEAIKPYLKIHPFTAKDVELKIYNYQGNRHEINDPFISAVSNNQGNLGFFTSDESNQHVFKTKKYESFEEAVAILCKEKR